MQKFYTNELIKGCILFFSLGLLYFVFTLFIEYFLWLKPSYRSVLFWLFVFVEFILFFTYIVIPISKLIGLKKGISENEAAKLIGNHFPEVTDKLLNVLQLKKSAESSELLEASIRQKSKELTPIPFKKAVRFSANKKYLKYAVLPCILLLLIYFSGNTSPFEESLKRVVNYTENYEPPAPFRFEVNSGLQVIEGENLLLKVKTLGKIAPKNVKIVSGKESFYLQNKEIGHFEYSFFNVRNSKDFYLEAEGVNSQEYRIEVLKKPMITSLSMELNYPNYTKKRTEVIENTGNAIVPKGTSLTWKIKASETDTITFLKDSIRVFFKRKKNDFKLSQKAYKNLTYRIITSNRALKNFESLSFNLQVIEDDFPKIEVASDIDSINRKPIQFAGRITDDYGISKLHFVYFDKKNPNDKKIKNIDFVKGTYSDFYYLFPEGIELDEGIDYEFYFEVFDNDTINGTKSTKSKIFSYYQKTLSEEKESLLKEQKESINSISKSLQKSKEQQQKSNELQKSILQKENIDWNEQQKIKDFLKRQKNYQKMMQKQSQKLKENLEKQSASKKMENKKKDLQKRLEEAEKLAEDKKLMDELEKLSEKMNKEQMFKKLQKLSSQSKRNEKTLERILELTKRFYVEQKANQLSEKIEKLSKEQNQLSSNPKNNTEEKQKEINKKFEQFKKELNELKKENKNLKRPMDLPNPESKTESIEKSLQKAADELKSGNKQKAKKHQNKGAKQMMQLSQMFQKSMQGMEMEQIDENIEDLQKILKNLLIFSFEQEDLMLKFSKMRKDSPQFSKRLKHQNTLKKHFEHIDDSLFVLSLRMVKMTNFIQDEVEKVHYNINSSLRDFPEGNIYKGASSQQFALTSANNLADMLSNILQSLQNASPKMSMGSGKGKGKMPMPDIIKKHSEMLKQMKSGKEKKGKGKGKEDMNGEVYEIYKQQQQIKEALQQLIKGNKKGKGEGKKAIKQMEELQNELLKKGITPEMIKKQQNLNYNLLKLEKATFKQGEDDKRESKNTKTEFSKRQIKKLTFEKKKMGYDEILQKHPLPLQTIYQQKVQNYFKKKNDSVYLRN